MSDVYIDALLVVLAVTIGVAYALFATPDYEPLMRFTDTTIGSMSA
jgi:hypothetical protein